MLDQTALQNYGLIVAVDEDASVGNTFVEASKHYRVTANQRGHVLEAGDYGANTRKLKITTGATTVYLPFWQNNIASVELPTAGPSVFVTDNMSGCCFYLGTKADGTLVAFHANSELRSGRADLEGKPANFQHGDTLKALDGLLRGAKAGAGVTSIVGGCGKAHYNQFISSSGKPWLGGTTIVGFRSGTSWEFWFQTWGSLGGGAVQVHKVEKFYPR